MVAGGQALHGMTATSTAFDDPAVIRDFVASGVEVMMIWIEVPLQCWKGPRKYDWSYAQKKLAHFAAHAGDTKWIIRVRLGLVAGWFGEANPTEVHQVIPASPGSPQGMSVCVIHSSVWQAAIREVIGDFVAWIEGTEWSPRVVGFMLNAGATEEWLPFDVGELTRGNYHQVYTREFRSWLSRAYGGDERALQAAWKGVDAGTVNGRVVARDLPTFATASCPTGHIRKGSHIWGPYSLRDPKEDRQAIDYYRFLAESLADALISFCRVAKEATRTPIIVGGFHSYLWWESGVYSYIQEYGHGLIQRLNRSSWIDFVSDITSYDCRYPGGPSGYLGVPHSLNLNGKLHYTEVDLVTTSTLPQDAQDAWAAADTSDIPTRTCGGIIPERVWNWTSNYCGRDEAEQIAIFQREHLRNVITGSPYWWFDIRGRDYQRPAFVRSIAQLSAIGKQAVGWDRTSSAEIAFVLSESSPPFQAAMNGEMVRFELESIHGLLVDLANRAWGLAGVPFDIYEIEDLAHADFPGNRYKLMVFVNCPNISAKGADGVRRWQKDGRVMCWTYAAGVLDESGLRADLSSELIGTRLGWRSQRQQIRVQIQDHGDALTAGGPALDFGTEGSVGPVFFADDPQATVLGRLRDGGEAAFTVKNLGSWRSVYLGMLNFGPALLRNLARFAGAHVWSDQDDAVYACRSIVALHTQTGGRKVIHLPRPAIVADLFALDGPRPTVPVSEIVVEAGPRRTFAWRTSYVAKP